MGADDRGGRARAFARSAGGLPVARALALILAVLLAPALALGAELQLRESLFQAQRDRITITVTAVVDHLGDEAHRLDTTMPLSGDDCDLHVPLRTRDIRVPVLGEIKNACSEKPAGTPRRYWSDRIYAETHGLAVPATGVFRIWLEHPPTGTAPQTEASRVPWYTNSNPDHQVELHPLLQVGSLDFRSHIKWIEDNGGRGVGYGPGELRTILNKRLTIQRITVDGEPYVRLRGTKTGNNHWTLRARLTQAPEPLADGSRVRLDVLDGNQVVPAALDLPAVAVAGTAADAKLQGRGAGDVVTFQALIRIHMPTILDRVGTAAQEIPLPVEFVLLDLE